MPSKSELARIHIAKKELCLDDDHYRQMLQDRYGVSSSKDMSDDDVRDLLAFCVVASGKPNPKVWQGRPHPAKDRKPMINKIIKLCDLLGRLGEGKTFLRYADGVAKNMFFRGQNVEIFVEHLDHQQLHKVISALVRQCKREGVEGLRE
ncbi:MAG: DUF1018 domain-containing protein [Magnetococcales bacterium]|nr:DUF1018 domain-containing protein [Magnetococcales bacterium]